MKYNIKATPTILVWKTFLNIAWTMTETFHLQRNGFLKDKLPLGCPIYCVQLVYCVYYENWTQYNWRTPRWGGKLRGGGRYCCSRPWHASAHPQFRTAQIGNPSVFREDFIHIIELQFAIFSTQWLFDKKNHFLYILILTR